MANYRADSTAVERTMTTAPFRMLLGWGSTTAPSPSGISWLTAQPRAHGRSMRPSAGSKLTAGATILMRDQPGTHWMGKSVIPHPKQPVGSALSRARRNSSNARSTFSRKMLTTVLEARRNEFTAKEQLSVGCKGPFWKGNLGDFLRLKEILLWDPFVS